MAKIRRTLFIGLGGTGMMALVKTKKMLYDNYGEIPPMVGFLGIDTDGGVYSKSEKAADGTDIRLTASEQYPITEVNPRTIYNRTPEVFDWIPKSNVESLKTLTQGAGATRSNGRFAITLHDDKLRDRIAASVHAINSASHINNPAYELLSNATEIHVVFSLGGGTGCGTFINLGYLLRQMYPNANDVKISGYALMADVFRSMVQGAGSSRVRSNAYGAILDLDYLMTLDTEHPFTFKWQRSTQTVDSAPYDAIYFIDNKNADNYTYESSEPLCDAISLALVTGIGELSVATASVADNVEKDIAEHTMDVEIYKNGRLVESKRSWVAGFGVSEVCFNATALARIFANKARQNIIDRLRNGGCDDPSSIANAWIDRNSIRENLGKDDVIDYFMTPAPRAILEDINPAYAAGDSEAFFNANCKENAQAMDDKLQSLKSRIELSLADLVKENINRECGVFNTEHILKVLISQIQLCDGEMEAEITKFEEEGAVAESEARNLVREIEDATGIFSGRKRKELCQDLCSATMVRVTKSREVQRRQLARNFYNWLLSLLQTRLNRVDTIYENLAAVYSASRNEIEAIRQSIGAGSFFSEDLTTVEVDKVECSAGDVVMNDFIRFMEPKGGLSIFASETSGKVGEWLREFALTLPKTKAYADTDLESILRALGPDEVKAILRRAVTKSLPLLPYNYKGYDTCVRQRPTDYYYFGVADHTKTALSKELLTEVISTSGNVQYSSTGLRDRVIIYHQVSVIPPFALESIERYETEYNDRERAHPGSSHWDMGLYERLRDENFKLGFTGGDREEAMGLWIEALLFGLVTYSPEKGQYMLRSRALGGRPLSQFRVAIGDSRHKAFTFFSEKLGEIRAEIDEAVARMNTGGPENPVATLPRQCKESVNDGTYLRRFSQCPIPEGELETYEKDYNLLNEEMEYILDNL